MPTTPANLAIHTITTRKWSLAECCQKYAEAGVGGVCVWRDAIAHAGGMAEAGKIVRASGLKVPSLVRGGFFVAKDSAARAAAMEVNRVCIDEAVAVGAEQIVLVCGAVPGISLPDARMQVADSLAKLLPYAQQANVKLSIEPLHPMYAGDRSCINRMAEARHICEQLKHPLLGTAMDVFHVWWDPDLEAEIKLAGEQKTLFGFHICDWKPDFTDPLNDRGLMGEGCIDLRQIRSWIQQAGFDGLEECEVFSHRHWASDPDLYLREIVAAYDRTR